MTLFWDQNFSRRLKKSQKPKDKWGNDYIRRKIQYA